jgi:hypothetical protein
MPCAIVYLRVFAINNFKEEFHVEEGHRHTGSIGDHGISGKGHGI